MKRSFLLILLVVAVLSALYFLPPLTVGDFSLRPVNLLSDVMADEADTLATEEPGLVSINTDYRDSVPQGMVPIEDFRDSLGIDREMDKFYAALDKAGERPVRIAYFGDSFIEGDIFTAAVRNLLQERYGGRGVGFIDIMSQVAGFRTTVVEHSRGWIDHNVIDPASKGFDPNLQGINARYYLPAEGACIDGRGQHSVFEQHLDTVGMATVFFTPTPSLGMTMSVNGKPSQPLYAAPDSVGQEGTSCTVRGKIGSIHIDVSGQGRFYGIALEGKTGIVLDSYSMRGSVGWHLSYIPEETLRQFAALRHYDLIIMHYGLNMVTPSAKGYTVYCDKFKPGIDHFRQAFPDASLLVVSVSDRDTRSVNGEFVTMKGLEALVSAQRNMAKEEGIAFWNLQQGMGGSGSMARLQQEGKANRDYTHINFQGGKELGQLFYDVLMNGKMNYDRRTKLQPKPKQQQDD